MLLYENPRSSYYASVMRIHVVASGRRWKWRVLNIFIVTSTETRQRAIDGYKVQQKYVRTMTNLSMNCKNKNRGNPARSGHTAPTSITRIRPSYIC
jgi:hypothetical protein